MDVLGLSPSFAALDNTPVGRTFPSSHPGVPSPYVCTFKSNLVSRMLARTLSFSMLGLTTSSSEREEGKGSKGKGSTSSKGKGTAAQARAGQSHGKAGKRLHSFSHVTGVQGRGISDALVTQQKVAKSIARHYAGEAKDNDLHDPSVTPVLPLQWQGVALIPAAAAAGAIAVEEGEAGE